VSYFARPPSRRRAGIVERLWRVEDPRPCSDPETICPDGRPEIVIHLGDAMQRQPRYLLVGQMERPLTVAPSGPVVMVGARLSPSGLHRLLPVSQDRLASQILSLEAVWNEWTRRTADQVASAVTPMGEVDAFERALEVLVHGDSANGHDRGVEAALSALRTWGGNVSIARLALDAGLSRRQFERRFREQVGLPPRLYARIVRFQRAFHALGHESGAEVAARCGYADQAHLVREIRRFAGQTPGLLAAADGLTAFFRQ
jgi:AraC-like DNA-binding protein